MGLRSDIDIPPLSNIVSVFFLFYSADGILRRS